jgi:two-component system, sensor histidine kinase and response regulator
MPIPVTSILLIEDDEEDFILLKKHLSRISAVHYEVIWETSYERGLARMLQVQHDLCLLDYRLGARNGIELITEARRQGYTLPIVLLTGATESEIDIQALQAGADDYIDKGQLHGELLHRIIRHAIERKKAAYEREKLLSEQIAARELEKKKNEFISIVVHEVKTPLTSLKGYAQLLRRMCIRSGDEQTLQLADRIDTQATKLTGLIDDLLDVTRIAGGTMHLREDYFPFDALAKEIVEDLQQLAAKPVILLQGATNMTIWGDRIRVGQVISNFLTNALKYAPMSDRVLVNIQAEDDAVTLCVQDFGPGIAKELQEKIFDPFYRIDTAEQGMVPGLGVGLHIAAEIIKKQYGRIWVESEKGHGATFCFTLPADHSASVDHQEDTVQGAPQA